MAEVTVIIEGPDRIEVYRPSDVRDVLVWHEQRPCGVAVFNPEYRVWVVELAGRTLWCASRTTAWHVLSPPHEAPTGRRTTWPDN